MSGVDAAELPYCSGFVRDSSKKQGNPGGDLRGEDPGGRVGRTDGYMDQTGTIDFQALERELQAALAADEKYKRENAAKLRAVEQRVPSYEEFRGIVLASHLKPLERKDKMGEKRSVPWNCHTIYGRTFPEVTTEISQEEIISQPTTSAEFYRNWRRHWRSDPERYQALLQLGGPELGRLFQVDVGFGLLGELLATLAAEVRLADRTAVLGILHSLTSTGRFALNLSLLSPAERESCRGLFQKLQAMGAARTLEEERCGQQEQGSEELSARLLQDLRAMYGVN